MGRKIAAMVDIIPYAHSAVKYRSLLWNGLFTAENAEDAERKPTPAGLSGR
jgi:hypothetical protein